jgi:hypothetical protein
MTKQRTPEAAMRAVEAATDLVVEQGGVIHEDAMWDSSEAALDGQPKQYLADIISGKAEGPYKPTSSWRTCGR